MGHSRHPLCDRKGHFDYSRCSFKNKEVEQEIESHREGNILVFCTVGCRSGAYARELQCMGFQFFDLWGGVLAWAWSGNEHVTPEGLLTRAVNVVGLKWKVLPQGYAKGW